MTFNEWLDATQERRDALIKYSQSRLPQDAVERHGDLDSALQNEAEASRLLSSAEAYLVEAEGRAVFTTKSDHPDLTAEERKRVARGLVAPYQLVVDSLSICRRSIDRRYMAILNANRSRL